ncbi:Amyloid-beta A4 precursor protein-binding family A member 1 [Bagarius yarrelli]|uniref:Amyloid-beta A4 protein-binding family A member 1 n=1 Tax=Bagarius yarrelli TaxID=175774 RepID=A0A556VX41_BAGYA|nr:Amyloid-beta A4 precursor protein-binding family A member 1 [Bagarius yarrelli]
MSQSEEAGSKAPPPQRILQPNSTPAEGGRPRWRPCQLNSQEELGNGHNHHHHVQHHYHRHSHQQQPGGNRAPLRRSRRHVPSHTLGGASEGGDAKPGQNARPAGSSNRRGGGDGGHHQTPRQNSPAVPAPPNGPEISPTLDALSPEESSQEVLTPSPQEDLNPSQNELISSSEEVTPVDKQDKGSPHLHCSSSTESSLYAHFEQTEAQPGEREQTEKCKHETDKWEVDECQEKKDEGMESYRKANQKEQMEKQAVVNTGGSKGSKKTSRRSRPIRVDVPPFEEFPHQPPPHFQSQTFSGFPIELIKEPNHLTATSTSESHQEFQTSEGTFSDSSSEACSTTYPTVCPTFYPVTSDREVFDPDQEHSEEQESFKKNHDMSSSEAQISLRVDQRASASVGSRLHHYDEQSGDEASSPDRGREKVWRRDEEQECSKSRKEQCDGEEKLEHGCIENRPQDMQKSVNTSGDVTSLAIKDIRDAIEEVKMKTMRSPYTAAKPEEPLWVRRRDVSPDDESQPQLPSSLSSPQNMTSFQVSAADLVVSQGAESSRTPEHNKADIRPSLPGAEETSEICGPDGTKKVLLSHSSREQLDSAEAQDERQQYRMICHVFESEDVSAFLRRASFHHSDLNIKILFFPHYLLLSSTGSVIAQSIGQSVSVASSGVFAGERDQSGI